MNEGIRKIISYYGINEQLKQFQCEVFELNEAIIKESNTGYLESAIEGIISALAGVFNAEHINCKTEFIKEKIADIMVILKQFQLFYNIPTDEIKEIMKDKVNKQLEYIAEENKKNVK